MFAHGGEDAHGVDALVHVQAHRVHVESGALGLAGPVEIGRGLALELLQRIAHHGFVAAGQCVVDELFDLGAPAVELQGGIDVRVVGPGGPGLLGIGFGRDDADFGVVLALVRVAIGDDGGLVCFRGPGFCALAGGFLFLLRLQRQFGRLLHGL